MWVSPIFWLCGCDAAVPPIKKGRPTIVFDAAIDGEQVAGIRFYQLRAALKNQLPKIFWPALPNRRVWIAKLRFLFRNCHEAFSCSRPDARHSPFAGLKQPHRNRSILNQKIPLATSKTQNSDGTRAPRTVSTRNNGMFTQPKQIFDNRENNRKKNRVATNGKTFQDPKVQPEAAQRHTMDTIQVAGQDLQFRITEVPPSLSFPNGEAIAKLFGADDPLDCVVVQWLPNGDLETLRLDEQVHLDDSESPRFIVFNGASTYLFKIDGRRFEWGAARIRGDVLKMLIGVDPIKFGVWQESDKDEDLKIANDKFADLKPDGLEAFFTAREESIEGDHR